MRSPKVGVKWFFGFSFLLESWAEKSCMRATKLSTSSILNSTVKLGIQMHGLCYQLQQAILFMLPLLHTKRAAAAETACARWSRTMRERTHRMTLITSRSDDSTSLLATKKRENQIQGTSKIWGLRLFELKFELLLIFLFRLTGTQNLRGQKQNWNFSILFLNFAN